MKNTIVKNTLILTAITVVSGLVLGLVYEITKDPIAAANEATKQAAYAAVLEDADSFETVEDFDADAALAVLTDAGLTDDQIDEVAVGYSGGDEVGYVITVTSHEGYGGDIQLSVGILNDGTVKGIEMLSIIETAGLGMRSTQPEFKDQFKDKNVSQFAYTKSGASADNEIDALSGATITTNAVTNAVNSALVYFQNGLGGSANE